jgi:hypothetical protein
MSSFADYSMSRRKEESSAALHPGMHCTQNTKRVAVAIRLAYTRSVLRKY